MLGAPERHPYTFALSDHYYRPANGSYNRAKRYESQVSWAQGRGSEDGEAEPGYDLACDEDELDDEHDGREPWLGAPENHAAFPDQDHWSQGDGQSFELDPADERYIGAALPYDVRRRYREEAEDFHRAARTTKRRLTQPGSDGLHRPWVGADRVYGLRVSGDCCAPYILDGGAVHVDQVETPRAGDFVVVFFTATHGGQPVMQGWVKRLAMNSAPNARWPHVLRDGENVAPVLMVETLNPPRRFMLDVSKVLAVHKVVDILPPVVAIATRERMANDARH